MTVSWSKPSSSEASKSAGAMALPSSFYYCYYYYHYYHYYYYYYGLWHCLVSFSRLPRERKIDWLLR